MDWITMEIKKPEKRKIFDFRFRLLTKCKYVFSKCLISSNMFLIFPLIRKLFTKTRTSKRRKIYTNRVSTKINIPGAWTLAWLTERWWMEYQKNTWIGRIHIKFKTFFLSSKLAGHKPRIVQNTISGLKYSSKIVLHCKFLLFFTQVVFHLKNPYPFAEAPHYYQYFQ